MQTATVIGAGITGPMAAITLARNGYSVNVYDARPAHDLHSDGILGITPDNARKLTSLGVNLARYELPNKFTDANSGETTVSPFHYITWTDLHSAITNRATEMGVTFNYAHKVESADQFGTDVTVIATGVGSAKEVTSPDYTGYVVIRGLAQGFAGTNWTRMFGDNWTFMIGDTRDGASITLFAKRDRTTVRMQTTYTAVAPKEVNELPEKWRKLVLSVPIFQIAPLSDWMPPYAMVSGQNRNVIRIGDSNGQLRPSTSMGANLGINEAIRLMDALGDGGYTEYELVSRRHAYYFAGKEMAI